MVRKRQNVVHKIYRKCSQISVKQINYCISGYSLSQKKEKRTWHFLFLTFWLSLLLYFDLYKLSIILTQKPFEYMNKEHMSDIGIQYKIPTIYFYFELYDLGQISHIIMHNPWFFLYFQIAWQKTELLNITHLVH